MKFQILILTLALAACSSKPTFKPEVDGEGDISGKNGGVVYSIPEQNPVLKMKLVSAVISKGNLLNVRMYFLRKSTYASEYMDPKEQYIVIAGSKKKIYPSKVHASASGKPLMKLSDAAKQTVELQYLMPTKKDQQYPYIEFNWKIHYKQNGKDTVIAKTEKFDYVPKTGIQQGVGQYEDDSDFPYMQAFEPYPVGWETPDWIWWGPF